MHNGRRTTTGAALVFTGMALATLPAAAAAHHTPCRWGVFGGVDTSDPEPGRVGVQAPTWGCTGPNAELIADAAGQHVFVHADTAGLDWEAGQAEAPPSAEPAPAAPSDHPRLVLRVSPRRAVAGRRIRFRMRATWVRDEDHIAAFGVRVRLAHRSRRIGESGSTTVVARMRRPGNHVAFAYHSGRPTAFAVVRVAARR